MSDVVHSSHRRRVGIVGFGALGQFLVRALLTNPSVAALYELVFVWNRSPQKIQESTDPVVPSELVLFDLADFASRKADIVVEVSHPIIYKEFGKQFLEAADLFVGSPTAFSDKDLYDSMYHLASNKSVDGSATGHAVYLPVGALWGAEDIHKMAQRGSITGLKITMRKPAESMRLEEPLQSKLEQFQADESKKELIIYSGSVRGLCPLAPNNVNTMACAAMASGPNVGFDGAIGELIAEKGLEAHIIDVEVTGKALAGRSDPFTVRSNRYNPCDPNAVTASATYQSFLSSLINAARPRGPGIHFC